MMPEHYRHLIRGNGEQLKVDLRNSDFRYWAERHLTSHDASQIIELYQSGNEDGAKKTLKYLTEKYV